MYATASLAERMSGSETISRSGVPARFRSMPLAFARPSCSDFPASSSRCARVTPIVFTVPSSSRMVIAPLPTTGLLVLADLIALRQIGIEIILAREYRARRDLRIDGEPELDRHAQRLAVEHGQHPRIGQIDQIRLRVGRSAVRRGRAREYLRARRELRVNLETDDDFPVAHHSYPRGRASVPVGGELELMRRAEQLRLREVRSDELQSHRQPVDEAARRRHAGQSREIRADGVDVVQIHGDRIVDLGADGEGRSRCRRPREQIHFLECGAKIVGDQAAHALRLQIIRIEIAGRQHVGAGHDAALDLGAEPLARASARRDR